MTYTVSGGTLNPTHSLTPHFLSSRLGSGLGLVKVYVSFQTMYLPIINTTWIMPVWDLCMLAWEKVVFQWRYGIRWLVSSVYCVNTLVQYNAFDQALLSALFIAQLQLIARHLCRYLENVIGAVIW